MPFFPEPFGYAPIAATREAYARMKPGKAYLGLRDAARSRQEADWPFGINCTRAQTLVMQRAGGQGVYSIGRIQTPTLALIVNRKLEIRDVVPKNFWTLIATFQAATGTYRGKWFRKIDGKDQDRFDREADAAALASTLAGLPGRLLPSPPERKRKSRISCMISPSLMVS